MGTYIFYTWSPVTRILLFTAPQRLEGNFILLTEEAISYNMDVFLFANTRRESCQHISSSERSCWESEAKRLSSCRTKYASYGQQVSLQSKRFEYEFQPFTVITFTSQQEVKIPAGAILWPGGVFSWCQHEFSAGNPAPSQAWETLLLSEMVILILLHREAAGINIDH